MAAPFVTIPKILDTLAALDVRLPLARSGDDPCTASGADGSPVFTVDVNGERSDEDAREITALLIDLINGADRAAAPTYSGAAEGSCLSDPDGGVSTPPAAPGPKSATASSRADDDGHVCPVCAEPFKAGDLCASDIEIGMCHAACLEGSPTVNLHTGEPIDGPIATYPYEGCNR